MARPSVVELACAAVRRLSEAAPTASVALEELDHLEQVSMGPPYTVAIAGDLAARTAALDGLAGEHLFDPARHDPPRVVMTLRRGAATMLRARRRDGAVEDRTLAASPGAGADATGAAAVPGGLVGDAEAAAAATAAQAATGAPPAVTAVTPDERGSPAAGRRPNRAQRQSDALVAEPAPAPDPPATPSAGEASAARSGGGGTVQPVAAEATELVRNPPWWAVWRWLVLWWQSRRSWWSWWSWWSGRAAAWLPAPDPAPAEPPAGTERARRPRIRTAPRAVDPRRQFVDALRACLADDAVERLFVEVGGGPLPEKLVVIELPSRANAMALDAVRADACLVACGEPGFAMTEQLEAVLTIVPHLFAIGAGAQSAGGDPRVRRLGSAAAVAAELPRLAMIERALAAGRRGLAVLASGCATLDAAIAEAEAGFRQRIRRLEALRVASPDAHTATALARIRQPVVEHAQRAIRRAIDQLDAAIEREGAAWSARLGDATSIDALRAAAAQLDDDSPVGLQAAVAEVHRALVDDLTEHARAQLRALVSELGRDRASVDPVPSWLAIEVSLGEPTAGTRLGAVAPRLSSLFRSLEALKAEALGQLAQRIAELRRLATANLLDSEPRLEPAVTVTVAIALRAELKRHAVWLEAELARVRVAVDAERAQLAVLAIARDTAATDGRELAAALDRLAAELP